MQQQGLHKWIYPIYLGLQFQGTFAWLVWMFIHIMSLVGFRNKAIAFLDWMNNYFTYDRPLGLIIRPYKRK